MEIQKIFNSFGDSKSLVIIIVIMITVVIGKTVFNQMDIYLKKADFFLSLGDMDSTIAIALQTLRSIGEIMRMNYYILTMMMTLALPLL